ncbi:MAG: hypothetical protein KGI11_04480 [Thaumarchaeota archaeon]|nr:hypothetical protein [Nitrososphaerota archaeon]
MPELCEHCGAPMKDWSATHCSEKCVLSDIQFSMTLRESSDFDALLSKMRKENRFDRKLLEELK